MNRVKRCLVPGVWALVVSLLVAVPAAAAGADESAAARRHTSLTTLSAATLETLQPSLDRATQSTGSGDPASSFFKTKKGVLVIVLVGGGFAYALYSKEHDRVLSQIR